MSYFDFINQSSVYPQQTQTKATSPTINIPVSIADELFATQSLNLDEQGTSNVFASPLYSLTDTKKTSKNNNRLVMSSSTLSSDSNSVNATPRLSGIEIGKRQHLQHNSNNMSDASIFGFINQSNKLDNARLEDLVFTSSSSSFTNQASLSPLNLQTTRPSSTLLNSSSSSSTKTVETQKLLEETKWKQAKAEQQLELDLIHQLYERRRITLNEIKKAQDSIKCSTTEKQKALESEDYEKVDTLDRQGRLLESKRDRLMYDVMESISQQLQTAWVKMADKTQMVKSCASTVVQVYQAYKDERYHQFEQYNMDMKRSHEQFAGEIKDERSTIESSKSELAFDLSYWKQAEMELDQKMVEAVHDKETQKEELMVKIQSTDVR
ncbi:hypothetical protein BC941DRAFT_241622 [Chlamydoabsidia padenii]|nr:hypothetical protein BC941DRAFT_241622 [Chlamydoabsidia padenii]